MEKAFCNSIIPAISFSTHALDNTVEEIYKLIFGSQISILIKINEKPISTLQEAKTFFNIYEKLYPETHGGYFSKWLNYLEYRNLIDLHNNEIRITEMGRCFLTYMIDVGLPQNKGL